MRYKLIYSLWVFFALPIFGLETSGDISRDSQFNLSLASSLVSCHNGKFSGSFPSPTVIEISLGYERDSQISPGAGIVNSETLQLRSMTKYCVDFPELKPSTGFLPAILNQHFTEVYFQNVQGLCMRIITEELTADILGNKFSGSASMVLSPFPSSKCR